MSSEYFDKSKQLHYTAAMKGICYIIGAGGETALDFTAVSEDFVIAVDGGLKYLDKAGIKPSLIIGDFDSLGYIPGGENVVRLNPEKDEADGYAAVNEGLKREYKKFKLYCMLGGRLSHSLANLHLLSYIARAGGNAELFGRDVTAVYCNSSLKANAGGYMSVIPVTEKAEVYISGCKYSGTFIMERSGSLGISNEPRENAEITVLSGEIFVMFEDKK